MFVKMNSARKGSPDGIQVNTYEDGEVYEVPDELGEVFLAEKWATKVKGKNAKASANNPANKEAVNAPSTAE